jgi:hypothetical protein
MRSPITTTILAHLAAAGLVGCPSSGGPAPVSSGTTSNGPTPDSAAPSAAATPSRGDADLGEVCKKDDDCKKGLYCTLGFNGAEFSETGKCTEDAPIYEGRPLLVDGEAKVAPLRHTRGWLEPTWADASGDSSLDEGHRAQWAKLLVHAAQEEHASVPSFARALCHLIALGAPAGLISKSQRAIGDEIRHTQICASWARRLGEEVSDPGALPEAVAPFPEEREPGGALLDDVFWGGCIGETLAAHRMQARASTAPLDDLGEAMASIADDEARHAALAFETVRWLVEQHPALRDRLDDHLRRYEETASPSDRATVAPLLKVLG